MSKTSPSMSDPGKSVLRIRAWFNHNRDRIAEALLQLVRIDTSAPNEERVFPLVADLYRAAGFGVEVLPLHSGVGSHSSYAGLPGSSLAPGRHTLRAALEETAGLQDLAATLLSAHVDVAPGAENVVGAGRREGGVLKGRGTCDNKNNVLLVAETVRCMRECGIGLARRPVADLVIEEEVGGTGALSSCLWGIPAAEVVVLEPTGLQVFRGHRGCIGIEIAVCGTPAHMGCSDRGVSAIDSAFTVVTVLRELEQHLVAEARRDLAFSCWQRPVQINIGSIRGGEWHGSIPHHCVLRVNLGFLPRYSVATFFGYVREELASRLKGSGIAVKVRLNGLRNDGYLLDESSPLVRGFLGALDAVGTPQQRVFAWNVSCDARLYAHLAKRPTVIFGCGMLQHAHTSTERLRLAEFGRGIEVLALFLAKGRPPTPSSSESGANARGRGRVRRS